MEEKITDRELRVNASGAPDPTAYEAIMNVEEFERTRPIFNSMCYKIVRMFYDICNFAGVRIQGSLIFKDDAGHVFKVKNVKN